MPEKKEVKSCKNPPCSCEIPNDENYCSTSCAVMGKSTNIDCECGHPDCKGDY